MHEPITLHLAPQVREQLWAKADPYDRRFLAGIFSAEVQEWVRQRIAERDSKGA